MAAAKALLTAAGFLPPKTRLPKTSTATEHATSSSRMSTATEHAPKDSAASTDDVSLRPLTGIPRSSASEDGLFLGDTELEKVVALLLWMAQDFQPKISADDIHHAALEALIKCIDATTGDIGGALGLLHTASIAKLSKVIDIMMLHKDGSPKDANATLRFMRRSSRIRDELLASSKGDEPLASMSKPGMTERASSKDNATERVEPDQTLQFMRRSSRIHDELLASSKGDELLASMSKPGMTERASSKDNATERVELDQDDVSSCYQRLGRNLITHDLLPHQDLLPLDKEEYRLRNNFKGDTYLSGFQRSFLGLTATVFGYS